MILIKRVYNTINEVERTKTVRR